MENSTFLRLETVYEVVIRLPGEDSVGATFACQLRYLASKRPDEAPKWGVLRKKHKEKNSLSVLNFDPRQSVMKLPDGELDEALSCSPKNFLSLKTYIFCCVSDG